MESIIRLPLKMEDGKNLFYRPSLINPSKIVLLASAVEETDNLQYATKALNLQEIKYNNVLENIKKNNRTIEKTITTNDQTIPEITNLYEGYHLGVGSSDAACNFLISLSRLSNTVEYIELPIFTPNDYMFENFAHLGKEKWEIYAEVAREIMCTLGNLKKSDMGIRDSFRYISCLEEKKLLDRDTYKIKSD